MVRLALLSLVLAACGDDGGNTPIDAAVDAAPDVAIDAPTCAAPNKMCGTSCLDVSADELNCGECGTECNGGEACNTTCACVAPTFIPASIPPAGGAPFEGFQNVQGMTVAFNANLGSGGLNPLLVGFDATTVAGVDIDLSTTEIGAAPFVAVGYGLDINAMTLDAAYGAVSGTLRFTEVCDGHVLGTLTDVTFQGLLGDVLSGDVTVDPDGCTITLKTVAFETGTADCPD